MSTIYHLKILFHSCHITTIRNSCEILRRGFRKTVKSCVHDWSDFAWTFCFVHTVMHRTVCIFFTVCALHPHTAWSHNWTCNAKHPFLAKRRMGTNNLHFPQKYFLFQNVKKSKHISAPKNNNLGILFMCVWRRGAPHAATFRSMHLFPFICISHALLSQSSIHYPVLRRTQQCDLPVFFSGGQMHQKYEERREKWFMSVCGLNAALPPRLGSVIEIYQP